MSAEMSIIDEPKAFSGWNAYRKNHWTEWAEKHGLVLADQEISKRPIRRQITTRRTSNIKRGIQVLRRYRRGPIHEWYDKRSGVWQFLPISEYKEKFDNSRPEWAKTFSERGISKDEIIGSHWKVSFKIKHERGSKLDKFWSIEREYMKSELKRDRMVIERLLDSSGRCKRVTLLHLREFGLYPTIRQEDWVSKGVWRVAFGRELSHDELLGSNYTSFIRKPKPWSSYLNK